MKTELSQSPFNWHVIRKKIVGVLTQMVFERNYQVGRVRFSFIFESKRTVWIRYVNCPYTRSFKHSVPRRTRRNGMHSSVTQTHLEGRRGPINFIPLPILSPSFRPAALPIKRARGSRTMWKFYSWLPSPKSINGERIRLSSGNPRSRTWAKRRVLGYASECASECARVLEVNSD